MPRINVILPDELHRACKIAAIEKGLTLRDYIVQRLEETL
jgi:hypothetical protein